MAFLHKRMLRFLSVMFIIYVKQQPRDSAH